MFKFLRKYNKWILVVGGTLLMITFLVPFSFQRQGGPRNALWATMGPEGEQTVTAQDAGRVSAELSVMQLWRMYLVQIAQSDQQPTPVAVNTALMLNQIPIDPDRRGMDPQHWFLLTHEAKQAGLVGGLIEADALLGADQLVVDTALATIAAQFEGRNVSGGDRFIRETLAKARGVARLMQMYQDAAHFSDRRLKLASQRYFHAVAADLLILEPTKEQIEAVPMPSPMRLAEHLQKYDDMEPGQGPNGFGYKLPDRVKFEWLSIPADSVRTALASGDKLNNIALAKHWKQNESLFGKADPNAPIPDAVRDDLLRTLTQQTLDDIAKYARDKVRLGQLRLVQREGYRIFPEDWSDLAFPDLALMIQQDFGIPLPVYESSGKTWLNAEKAAALPGIGAATSDEFGTQPTRLSEMLMNARELGGDPSMPVQKGLAGPVLRRTDGSVYLFRILEVDPARAPVAIEEVQQALVDDLRRLDAYESLVASIPAIREQAATQGLLATSLEHHATIQPGNFITLTDPMQLQMSQRAGQTLSPTPTQLPVIGAHEPTVSAIIDFARSIPIESRVFDLPLSQRTVVVPVPDHLALVVAQLVDQQPVTSESFASLVQSGSVESLLTSEELGNGKGVMSAFEYEAMARRHNFVLIRPPSAEDEESADESSSSAPVPASAGG